MEGLVANGRVGVHGVCGKMGECRRRAYFSGGCARWTLKPFSFFRHVRIMCFTVFGDESPLCRGLPSAHLFFFYFLGRDSLNSSAVNRSTELVETLTVPLIIFCTFDAVRGRKLRHNSCPTTHADVLLLSVMSWRVTGLVAKTRILRQSCTISS